MILSLKLSIEFMLNGVSHVLVWSNCLGYSVASKTCSSFTYLGKERLLLQDRFHLPFKFIDRQNDEKFTLFMLIYTM